jgi:hypothetical protein
MQFRAAEYYQASLERMQQAHGMYREGKAFALAMYCAGLAVECLLRAFRWTADTTFEGRHDLFELLRASRFLKINEDFMRLKNRPEDEISASGRNLQGAMNEVVVLWHNNLRFASEASARAFLNRIDRLRGIKGDPLRKNAGDLLDAAQTVINRGVALWTSMRKS